MFSAGSSGVAGRLPVVNDVGPLHHLVGVALKLVILEVACQADADPVRGDEQFGLLRVRRAGRDAVGVDEQAGGKALLLRAAEGAAAAHGIPQPVVEDADARPGDVELGGVDAAGIIGHLAEVPALAVDVDLLAVHARPFRGSARPGRRARSSCWTACDGPSGRSGSRPPCSPGPR